MQEKIYMTWACNGCLDITSKAQTMKDIINKLDFIKINSFCSVKGTVKRMRRKTTDWEKTFVKTFSDKDLL